jgi:serine/threonine-protein kinase
MAIYVLRLQQLTMARTELARKLGQTVPQIVTALRNARLLPLHDIRPDRARVRAQIAEVEATLRSPAGREAVALGDYVLGEGHLTLGEDEAALTLLEKAWAAGQRGPEIDVALGRALGRAYERELDRAQRGADAVERAARLDQIATRYRDPALAHLRAAVGVADVPPSYLEALVLFHAHNFAEAAARAHAAFTQAPSFYEGGLLEAEARDQQAEALFTAEEESAAKEGFVAAQKILRRVAEIARSDDEVAVEEGRVLLRQLDLIARHGDLPPDHVAAAEAAFSRALQINPDNLDAPASEAALYNVEAAQEVFSGKDPRAKLDQALALVGAVIARVPDHAEAQAQRCVALRLRGVFDADRGIDPRPGFTQAIEACLASLRREPDRRAYYALGSAYVERSTWDSAHGGDPTADLARGAESYRHMLAIEEDGKGHSGLATVHQDLAFFEINHGLDDTQEIELAMNELQTVIRLDKTYAYSGQQLCTVMGFRAFNRFYRGLDPRAVVAEAIDVCQRSIATDPTQILVQVALARLRTLRAEYLVRQKMDPTAALNEARRELQPALRAAANDGTVHFALGAMELAAGRWALAHGNPEPAIARGEAHAALALKVDPTDCDPLVLMAELAELRVQYQQRRGRDGSVAAARGLGFIGRALAIDPNNGDARRVRDEITRLHATR